MRHENLLRQTGGQTHGPRARRTQGTWWRALARHHLASDHPSLAVQWKHNTTHPAHHPARRHRHEDGRAGAAEADGDERERRQAQRHRAHGPSAAVSYRRCPRRESPGPISDRATCLAHYSPPTPVAPISLIESPISTSDRLALQCCALIGRVHTVPIAVRNSSRRLRLQFPTTRSYGRNFRFDHPSAGDTGTSTAKRKAAQTATC